MQERLTWKQMQEKYPGKWLGLADVQFVNNDGVSVESAVVKYADLSKGELDQIRAAEGLVCRFTTPDSVLQLGNWEVM